MKGLNFFLNLNLEMGLIFLGILFLMNSFGQGFLPISDNLWGILFDDSHSLCDFLTYDWDRELYNFIKLIITLSLAHSLTSWLVTKTNSQANRFFVVFSVSYFFIILQTLPLFAGFAFLIQEDIIKKDSLLIIFSVTIIYFSLLVFFIHGSKKKLAPRLTKKEIKIEWYWWLISFFFIPFAVGWFMWIPCIFFGYGKFPLGVHPVRLTLIFIFLILFFTGLIMIFYKFYLKLKKCLII